MFHFIGILAILVGIAVLVIVSLASEGRRRERPAFGGGTETIEEGRSPDWMLSIKERGKKLWILILSSGVLVFIIPFLFFFAERGYSYLLVYPTGKMDAIMSQGIKWRGLAKIDEWQKYIDVKTVGNEIEGDSDEIEGVMNAVDLRFIDQVTATGYVSTRFQMPVKEENFINMAVQFRTMSNLVNNTIIPTVKEQLVQTAYMFAAQDYISGEAQAFRQTFEEQLKHGTYRVDKEEYNDTVYANVESKEEGSRKIREIQTRYVVEKIKDENGVPFRIPHEVSENNIRVAQVIVDELRLEETFKKRLEAQRDESAKRQLEQQKIKTAKAEQRRVIAQGERDKAAERVTQEKQQVKTLIAKETMLKEERTNKELAQIALETQRLRSQKVKVKADAEAYEIAKKVRAGITPEKELQMRLKAQVDMMDKISNTKWPQYYIVGGQEGNGNKSPLESIITATMANQLKEQTGKKK